jgi:hypothetical protein
MTELVEIYVNICSEGSFDMSFMSFPVYWKWALDDVTINSFENGSMTHMKFDSYAFSML